MFPESHDFMYKTQKFPSKPNNLTEVLSSRDKTGIRLRTGKGLIYTHCKKLDE